MEDMITSSLRQRKCNVMESKTNWTALFAKFGSEYIWMNVDRQQLALVNNKIHSISDQSHSSSILVTCSTPGDLGWHHVAAPHSWLLSGPLSSPGFPQILEDYLIYPPHPSSLTDGPRVYILLNHVIIKNNLKRWRQFYGDFSLLRNIRPGYIK